MTARVLLAVALAFLAAPQASAQTAKSGGIYFVNLELGRDAKVSLNGAAAVSAKGVVGAPYSAAGVKIGAHGSAASKGVFGRGQNTVVVDYGDQKLTYTFSFDAIPPASVGAGPGSDCVLMLRSGEMTMTPSMRCGPRYYGFAGKMTTQQ